MVDIEQADALQQLTRPLGEGFPHALRGRVLVDDQSDVLLGEGETREQPDAGDSRLGPQQGPEVEFHRAGPGGQPEGPDDLGVQLAGVADRSSRKQ